MPIRVTDLESWTDVRAAKPAEAVIYIPDSPVRITIPIPSDALHVSWELDKPGVRLVYTVKDGDDTPFRYTEWTPVPASA